VNGEGYLRKVIIAVGGTGQVVLHYYNQLFLLGLVKEPYRAVVIDTDELDSTLAAAQDFFSHLRLGNELWDGAGGSIPTIEYIRVANPITDQVSRALTALTVEELDRDYPRHPVRAYFSKDALTQTVKQGLYARPALSAVISRDWVRDDRLTVRPDCQVVVVGSLIGGTGGGLISPLLARLGEQRRNVNGVAIRAVFFGQYFDPDPGLIERPRFSSNQVLGLASVSDVQEAIDHFAVIGVVPEEQMGNREQPRGYSAWPQNDASPFWRGTEMLNEFLYDRVRERKTSFRDREVGTDQVSKAHKVPLDLARHELRKRFGRAKALVDLRVAERMQIDPFANWVWGKKLVRTVADFWSITAPSDRSAPIAPDFCSSLQQSLESWWQTATPTKPSVSGLFPAEQTKQPSLWSIKSINWPRVIEATVNRLIVFGVEQVVPRAAATLILWALRG